MGRIKKIGDIMPEAAISFLILAGAFLLFAGCCVVARRLICGKDGGDL